MHYCLLEPTSRSELMATYLSVNIFHITFNITNFNNHIPDLPLKVSFSLKNYLKPHPEMIKNKSQPDF